MDQERAKLPWEEAIVKQIDRISYMLSYESQFAFNAVKALKNMLAYMKDEDIDTRVDSLFNNVSRAVQNYIHTNNESEYRSKSQALIDEAFELLILKAARHGMIPAKMGIDDLEDDPADIDLEEEHK